MRCLIITFSLVLSCISILSAQQPQTRVTEKKLVRVGVALPLNQSSFVVSNKWGRDQIIRNLQALRTDKKSEIIIEPVSLDSSQKNDVMQEGAGKHCDYVVLTRIMNFSNTGGVMLGPSGMEAIPPMPGNVDPKKRMGVDFSIMRPGHPTPVAEGRTAAPTETPSATAQSDNAAMEDAARHIALRVAGEIRTQVPIID
jgi:hypothetical protein